jgi:hypothetical protein
MSKSMAHRFERALEYAADHPRPEMPDALRWYTVGRMVERHGMARGGDGCAFELDELPAESLPSAIRMAALEYRAALAAWKVELERFLAEEPGRVP